jgi:UPF0271 protein
VIVNTIDLNADAGESFGPWPMGNDAALFPLLSSVNLACGFHAGDPVTIGRTVRLARETGVRIGAHPGFPDLSGFGRRDMNMSPEELHAAVLYQLGALDAFVRAEGLELHHVKPHGALYLRMARDEETAHAVARAVSTYDPALPFVVLGGPGGQAMQDAARTHGLPVVLEAFPDRAYLSDGRLAPRSMPDSLIRDPQRAAERAVQMVRAGEVAALDGGTAPVEAHTLCIHGDNPEAPEIARAVRSALEAAGITVRAF